MFNYNNIGKKIKGLAKGMFIANGALCVIVSIVLLALYDFDLEDAWWALLIMIFGPIISWFGSWLIYGFGELIDKARDIERNTRGESRYTQNYTDSGEVNKEHSPVVSDSPVVQAFLKEERSIKKAQKISYAHTIVNLVGACVLFFDYWVEHGNLFWIIRNLLNFYYYPSRIYFLSIPIIGIIISLVLLIVLLKKGKENRNTSHIVLRVIPLVLCVASLAWVIIRWFYF